ncbi:hypothetical protein JCM12298_28000 [Desulfothermus naphthae]
MDNKLKENTLIEAPFWNEPVKIEKMEEIGTYIRIESVHLKIDKNLC